MYEEKAPINPISTIPITMGVYSEIIAGRFGIGYKTWESYVISEYPPIVMGMVLIGLMGAFSSYIVLKITEYFMPWRTISKDGI
jgi:NitT/TauT family transport system permease protein